MWCFIHSALQADRSLPVSMSAHTTQDLCVGLDLSFATTSGPTATVFKDVTKIAPSLSCEVAQFKEKPFPK